MHRFPIDSSINHVDIRSSENCKLALWTPVLALISSSSAASNSTIHCCYLFLLKV